MYLNLKPFDVNSTSTEVEVKANCSYSNKILNIEYQCAGKIDGITIPYIHDKPQRLHSLWQHTCFEAFINFGEDCYWEVNCSPSKDWNIYYFDRYRKGQTEELRISNLHCEVFHKSQKSFIIQWILNLKSITPNNPEDLSIGICSILEHANKSKSYWALKHCASKPDFHQRKSFCLNFKTGEL